jgi:hypothetical protein
LRIQLHISYPEEVLIVKFNFGLLTIFHHQIDLFESPSLESTFLWALVVEHKVASQNLSSPTRYSPSAASPSHSEQSIVSLASPSTPGSAPWCNFHKTNFYAFVDFRILKSIRTNQTLFAEVAKSDFSDYPEIVSLNNHTEVDPSLILMTTNEIDVSNIPMFTHNCQIKHELATLILNNGIQINLVSQNFITRLNIPTTLHPTPYQLGWVQKEGPHLIVSQCCVVIFLIIPFRDIVVCDVSSLDCFDLLLGIPYQQAQHTIYHAKSHQYHLQHEGRTYVLTSSALKSTQPITDHTTVNQVSMNQCLSLCLVCPINLDN